MKKTAAMALVAILALTMTLLLAACGGEAETAPKVEANPTPEAPSDAPIEAEQVNEPELNLEVVQPRRGIIGGNIYGNEYLGVRIEIPTEVNASFDSEETLAEKYNDGVEVDFLEEIPESFWERKEQFLDMVVVSTSQEPNTNVAYSRSYVNVIFTRIEEWPEEHDTLAYINSLTSRINEERSMSFTYEANSTPIKIGDNEWYSYTQTIYHTNQDLNFTSITHSINLINIAGGFRRNIVFSTDTLLDSAIELPDAFSSDDYFSMAAEEGLEVIHHTVNDFVSWITPYEPIDIEAIKEAQTIPRGTWAARKLYTSEYLGFAITLPDDWDFHTDEIKPSITSLNASATEEVLRLTSGIFDGDGEVPVEVWSFTDHFEEVFATTSEQATFGDVPIEFVISYTPIIKLGIPFDNFVQSSAEWGAGTLTGDIIELGNFQWHEITSEARWGYYILVAEDSGKGIAIRIASRAGSKDQLMSWLTPYP